MSQATPEDDSHPTTEPPAFRELRYYMHLIRLNKLVLFGLVLAIAFVILAFFGPLFVPASTPTAINTALGQSATIGNSDISAAHPLGVDDLGRDMLGMIILALRLDLGAAFLVVIVGVAIGTLLGSVAGYFGGIVDEALMRVTDIFLAFPLLILALGVAAAFGRNLNNLILALVIVSWPVFTRLIRSQVLVEKEKVYVERLKVLGISRTKIILRHVVPNSFYPVLIQATLQVGTVLLTFASLSFLGFALSPFTPELGRMVLDGSNYLNTNPLLITFPGVVILTISLAFNLVGDGLRDVLDPRLRR